ncbi:MAG: hypothetical protein ACR5LA_07385 [Wolbachia sp.]
MINPQLGFIKEPVPATLMNKNGQRVTLESRNSVSYSDDKKRSTGFTCI